MIRNLIVAGAFLAALSTPALADPIEGTWKTGDNALVKISACGGNFCVDVADGKYAGKRSGTLAPKGGQVYAGTLKQFSTGISFSGTATLKGSSMSMVAKKFGITVKTDTWRKQ